MTEGAARVEDRIIECILKVDPSLDRARIGPGSSFRELGLASIEVLSIVFEIEEEFRITLVDAGLDRFETLGDAVTVVSSLTGASA